MERVQFRILQTGAEHLKFILLILSLYVLLRGHNHPGGGFIGGILAGSGFIVDAIAHHTGDARKKMKLKPVSFIITGLILIIISIIIGPLHGKAVLEGIWISIKLPLINEIKAGSPLLFDAGIYLVVAGTFIMIIFSIIEES
jgi:multicomponent Na+:H+ antiporter subunit B